MSKHIDLGQYATAALGQYFELIPGNIGADAHLSKRGMTFDTKSCEIKGVGHLCVMRMNAFMGLMKMETIVIAPTKVDMPLFNVDWVGDAHRGALRHAARALARGGAEKVRGDSGRVLGRGGQ